MSTFYEELAEILEVEPGKVTPELRLAEVSWDSLAIVSTIALIDDHYDEAVSAAALTACETVGDIERLVPARATESGA